MQQLVPLLAPRWLGVLGLLLALGLAVWLLIRRQRRQTWSVPQSVASSACALAATGALALPPFIGMLLAGAALALLFCQFLWLILTSQWWTPLALAALAAAVLGLGGWAGIPAGEALIFVGKTLRSVEFVQPVWLLLLLLIPVMVFLSYRSLAGLGTFRRWTAIGLRCALVLLLTLALAEARLRQGDEIITTLFLLDRSLSVPVQIAEGAPVDPIKGPVDQRWERVKNFINEAVEKRGDAHKRDRAGLIVFGRRPRLELPPSDAPRFKFTEVASNLDPNYTDIGAALKLALASFPEGTAKRIVLISDGNENLGNALEQARFARQNGVQIDVVPLAAGERNTDEVLVQSVEAPPLTEQGSRFPVRVLIRSYNPRPVKGTLELVQIADGQVRHVPPSPWGDVVLRPGLNSLSFPPPEARPKGSYSYEAKFRPEWVVMEDGTQKKATLGRIQNKQASTHVIALGQRRILLVEKPEDPETKTPPNEHRFLVELLRGLPENKFRIDELPATRLPKSKADLGIFLSNYDCVVLANLPSDMLDEDQQELIRSNTYDQGAGLIMIGGPDSFGAGGWQATPIEKALPVDCDIKALKVQGKGGLVLIMHACEIPDGNVWEKKMAKLAINKLGPADMLGVLGLGWQGTEWHVKFETVGDKKEQMKRQVDRMTPSDIPEFDTALKMAYDKLSDPKHELAKKHIILISDGDPAQNDKNLLAKMRAEKITITTVGVATHDASTVQNLAAIAQATAGRFYKVNNAKALPEIYTKESRVVSQSFIDQRRFLPKLVLAGGPTDRIPENLQPLYGFVRTTPKPSPLVQSAILGPPQGDQDFPVLAYWHYGLGKSVAFTSDARSGLDRLTWDRDWAKWEMYLKFWEQVLDWSLRAVETGRLLMNTEYRDGQVRIVVDARDQDNKPLTDLSLRGGVTTPLAQDRKLELKFEQKNSGQYEAEFKALEAGSYFLNAQAKRKLKRTQGGKEVEVEETDSIRSGVSIPYSPEFADLESNLALLDQVRALTGGTTTAEDSLSQAAQNAAVFRAGLPTSRSMQPIWFWLVLLAGVLLFFDVGVRRIAIEPAEVYAAGQRYWQKLRGQLVAVSTTPQFLDRLKSKKAQIGATLGQGRAAARFEPMGTAPLAPPPGALAGVPQKPTTSAPRPVAPKAGAAAPSGGDDFASRLMRAKKKAMEERDKK